MLDPMMTPDSLIAGMRGKNDYFTDGHRERVGINNSYRCFNIQCPAMTHTWLKFQQKTQRGVCVCVTVILKTLFILFVLCLR